MAALIGQEGSMSPVTAHGVAEAPPAPAKAPGPQPAFIEPDIEALNRHLREATPEVHAAYARLGERARALRAAGALKPPAEA
jgi:hypothetical protein